MEDKEIARVEEFMQDMRSKVDRAPLIQTVIKQFHMPRSTAYKIYTKVLSEEKVNFLDLMR